MITILVLGLLALAVGLWLGGRSRLRRVRLELGTRRRELHDRRRGLVVYRNGEPPAEQPGAA